MTAEEMLAEAKRLTELQKSERGTVVNGKGLEIPGPYVRTPERAARARKILSLRRRAARIMHPVDG